MINSLQTFKKKERTRTRCFQNQVLSRTRCLLSAIFSLLYGQTPTTVSQVLLELGACCRQFFSLLYGQTPTTVSVLRTEVKYQENDQVLLERSASRTRCLLLAIFFVTQSLISNPYDAILNLKTRRLSSSIFLKTCIGQTPTGRKRAYVVLNQ